MAALADAVATLLNRKARGRRIKVGLFYRGNPALVQAVVRQGYRTVVVGDKFRQLYRLQGAITHDSFTPFTMVEGRFDHLPFAPKSLDALILSRGMPKKGPPLSLLAHLKSYLNPGGILLWPHPVKEGFRGKAGRISGLTRLGMSPPTKRHELTELMMLAGFGEVGQQKISKTGITPWILSFGTVGTIDLMCAG